MAKAYGIRMEWGYIVQYRSLDIFKFEVGLSIIQIDIEKRYNRIRWFM